MAEAVPESWQIFIEQYPQLMKLVRKLGKLDWYKAGGWAVFVGHYHAGIYMQLYKANWYNYSLDGIHFEFGMTAESLDSKKLNIDLHIGHKNLFDREKFNELTIAQMEEVVSTWEAAYSFSKRNLSDRLSLEVPFTKTGFANQLADAFTQMAELAPIIDEGLEKLS